MTLLLLLACQNSPEGARAWQMESLDEAVGGPKSTARVGDFRMENEHLRVGILDARYSLGPSPYGGTLADIDVKRSDPDWGGAHGNDRFAEMFATVNMNIAAADTDGQVTILNDGSDGPSDPTCPRRATAAPTRPPPSQLRRAIRRSPRRSPRSCAADHDRRSACG